VAQQVAGAKSPSRRLTLPKIVPDRAVRSLGTLGSLFVLTVGSMRFMITDIVRGKFPWKEFIHVAWFIVGVSLVPTILVAIPFGVIIAIQVGSLAQQVGAESFMGAVNGLVPDAPADEPVPG
jgi:phospholipid/cholesterol/gamma-HCH transport system permease protein